MNTRRFWVWGCVFAALALSAVAGVVSAVAGLVWIVTENMGGVR